MITPCCTNKRAQDNVSCEGGNGRHGLIAYNTACVIVVYISEPAEGMQNAYTPRQSKKCDLSIPLGYSTRRNTSNAHTGSIMCFVLRFFNQSTLIDLYILSTNSQLAKKPMVPRVTVRIDSKSKRRKTYLSARKPMCSRARCNPGRRLRLSSSSS
jgi:hypothetical protein